MEREEGMSFGMYMWREIMLAFDYEHYEQYEFDYPERAW